MLKKALVATLIVGSMAAASTAAFAGKEKPKGEEVHIIYLNSKGQVVGKTLRSCWGAITHTGAHTNKFEVYSYPCE